MVVRLLLVLTVVVGVCSAQIAEDVSVLTVTTASDWQIVLDSAAAWVVGISESEKAPDTHEKMPDMLGEMHGRLGQFGVKYAHLDCAQKALRKVCRQLPIQAVPAFGFITDVPTLNPYSKKMHRGVTLYDGAPGDLKAFERRFAKHYPGDAVTVATSAAEIPAASASAAGTIVVGSAKAALGMFAKSICYAFPDVGCAQLSKPTEEDAAALGLPGGELPAGKNWVGHRSADGVFALAPQGAERAEALQWLAGLTGREAEAAPPAAEAGEAAANADAGPGSNNADSVEGQLHSAASFTHEQPGADAAYVVRVHAAADTAHKEQRAAWTKVARSLDGSVRAAQVACAEGDENKGTHTTPTLGQALCARKALPYTAVIPFEEAAPAVAPGAAAAEAGDGAAAAAPPRSPFRAAELDLFAADDGAGAKRAALASLPEEAVRTIGEADLDYVLVESAQARKVALIVLSDKENVPIMLRNVAVTLAKWVQVYFVSEPSAEFLGRLGPSAGTKLPTALLAAPVDNPDAPADAPPQHSIMAYDSTMFGPLSRFQNLQNFVLSGYHRSSLMEDAEKEAAAARSSLDVSGELQEAVLAVGDQAAWEEHCGSTYRGLCVVGLLPHAADAHAVGQELLTSIMRGLGAQGAAFRFLSVDGECQASFGARFDIDAADLSPGRLVVYSPLKGRYMALRGVMDAAGATAFLREVLAGKASSTTIPQRPELSVECEYVDPADAAAMAAEEDPLGDDFMEEIRREEEAARAAMEAELAAERKAAKEAAKAEAEAAKAPKKTIRKVVKKKKKGGKKKAAAGEL